MTAHDAPRAAAGTAAGTTIATPTQAQMRGFYNDKVVIQFTIATVVWGIVGMLVGVIIAAQLLWPDLTYGIPWLSYGRLRPLHDGRDEQPRHDRGR